MTLESLTNLGSRFGWDNPVAGTPDLKSVLTELQGWQVDVIRGADTASVDLSISGIATTDTILKALRFDVVAASGLQEVVEIAAASIKVRSTGNVRVTAATNKIDFIVLFWYDKA